MALKKSDLYSSLWKSCDELRGGMDASQYKDYILTLLFVKYVSDKAKSDLDSLIDVPEGGSFDEMLAAKGDKEIGDRFNKIVAALAEANGLQKVIDLADFNDEEKLGKGKEMQDRLSALVTIFADLDFRGSRAEGDDLLGDAYEYLMRHFATESGKSKGQFYTPAEVSRILAKVVGISSKTKQDQTVYDPACGSGSLLLKAAAEAPQGITIYGQEKDNATWALSRMNMILHGNEFADIRKGDTITSPHFTKGEYLQTFDYIVMNPPFSVKSWSHGLDKEYGRFEYGRPPEKNGDYAFLLHVIKSLKSTGKAALILPHGVLFRGGAEASIRKELVKRGYIKGIIGLPPNLFYGTGIPACIIIIDKENATGRTGVFMIDASKGFRKDGPKNRLRSRDIHKIVDVFSKQTPIDRYSRSVPIEEIADSNNDYNLNIPRYIDSSEPDDIHDLNAHLHGGIPDSDLDTLDDYWHAFPTMRSTLFLSKRANYSELAAGLTSIQQTVVDSDEFKNFAAEANKVIDEWFSAHREQLKSIDENTRPAELIGVIGEDLMARFRSMPLLDEYDIYEQLMAYWDGVMHDDVALIMNEGWLGAAKPRKTIEDKDRKLSEMPDLVIGSGRNANKYKMDLLPPPVIVDFFFKERHLYIGELVTASRESSAALEEYVAEHFVEDGLLANALDDDKMTKALATARLKEVKKEGIDQDEIEALEQLIQLYDAEAAAKKSVKEAQAELDRTVLEEYSSLSEGDVKSLLLDEKWLKTIRRRIEGVVASLAHSLVARIQQLVERYSATLAEIDLELASIRTEITDYLSDMGIEGLLEGRRRLPGFNEQWNDITLGDHVTYVKTVALPRAQLDTDSSAKYLHYGDIHTSEAIFLNAAKAPMPRVDEKLIKNAGRLNIGDLVFADASEDPAGVGKSVEIVDVPADGVVAGLHTIAARFDKTVLADGFKAYLQFIPEFRNALLRLAAGTKVLATTRRYISSVTLRLPSVEEQKAIVAALNRVNREIEIAQIRLRKSRDIEIGMRQQLLQGRTRLPATGGCS